MAGLDVELRARYAPGGWLSSSSAAAASEMGPWKYGASEVRRGPTSTGAAAAAAAPPPPPGVPGRVTAAGPVPEPRSERSSATSAATAGACATGAASDGGVTEPLTACGSCEWRSGGSAAAAGSLAKTYSVVGGCSLGAGPITECRRKPCAAATVARIATTASRRSWKRSDADGPQSSAGAWATPAALSASIRGASSDEGDSTSCPCAARVGPPRAPVHEATSKAM